jgi:translation initiation factor 2 subunit 3
MNFIKIVMEKIIKLSSVIKNQSILNIGTAGHVSHGKSTVTKCLSEKATQKFKSELVTNCTIKLGYANFKISVDSSGEYHARQSNWMETPDEKLVTHISIVDCPGHDAYMATMIGGSTIMDLVMLIIAGDQSVPQPQTHEHLLCLQLGNLAKEDYLVLHNKLDLLTRDDALQNFKQIEEFIEGGPATEAPILPISAATGQGVGKLVNYLAIKARERVRKITVDVPARMMVVRSFNVNKAKDPVDKLVGGVIGGTLQRGVIEIDDVVEIRPGVLRGDGKLQILLGRVKSINSENNNLEYAIQGGLVGICLTIDAGLASSNKLAGSVAGHFGSLPPIFTTITVTTKRLKLMNTVDGTPSFTKQKHMKKGERIKIISCGSMVVDGSIKSVDDDTVKITLDNPICTEVGSNISYMRTIDGRLRLAGAAIVLEGDCKYEIVYPEGAPTEAFVPHRWKLVDDISPESEDEIHSTDDYWFDYEKFLGDIKLREEVFDKTIEISAPIVEFADKKSEWSNVDRIIEDILKVCDCCYDLRELILKACREDFVDGINARYNSEGSLVFDKKKVSRADLQRVVNNSILVKIFKCPSCKGFRTSIKKIDGVTKRCCKNCLSQTQCPKF